MAKYNVASFTGHRIIKNEHKQILPKLLRDAIKTAYEDGCRIFCVGGALGFDTMAADAVMEFRALHNEVELHMIIPCYDQDKGWSDEDRQNYRATILAADLVRFTGEEYTKDCMKFRNQVLVDKCDVLIAYYYKDRSGTSQTVRMAKRAGKEVCNLADVADKM